MTPDGSTLAYASFLGGSGVDSATAIAVRAGHASVAGHTDSYDFPTTAGADDPTLGGPGDAFAATLSRDGSTLLFSTLLGGGIG